VALYKIESQYWFGVLRKTTGNVSHCSWSAGRGLCSLVCLDISGVKRSGSATEELV
jgi:hypothetical protein